MPASADSRVFVITGANRGLGVRLPRFSLSLLAAIVTYDDDCGV